MRPIVDYNSVIWSPLAKHDIELVEKVQRRFTKRLRGLRNLSYCDRFVGSRDVQFLLSPKFAYKGSVPVPSRIRMSVCH